MSHAAGASGRERTEPREQMRKVSPERRKRLEETMKSMRNGK